MKRKTVSCLLALAAVMTLTPTIPTLAADAEGQTTQEVTTAGTQSTTVTYQQDSAFTVTIPKTITLNQDKSATYNVNVKGDIAGNEYVTVIPDENITLTDSNGKAAVTGNITQDILKFAAAEVNLPDGGGTTGSIVANDLTAGDWSGIFQFKININAGGTEITQETPSNVADYFTITEDGVLALSDDSKEVFDDDKYNSDYEEYESKHPDVKEWHQNREKAEADYNAANQQYSEDYTTWRNNRPEETDSKYINNNEQYQQDYDVWQNSEPERPNQDDYFGNLGECPSYDDNPDNFNYHVKGKYYDSLFSLQTLTIPSEINGIKVTRLDDNIFDRYDEDDIYEFTTIIIPEGVKSIGRAAFRDCNLQTIEIPSSVSDIDAQVFEGCSNLTSITIPDSVTNIGSEMVARCRNLTNVVMSKNITSIPDNTFSYCSNLKSITLSDNLIDIGRAFTGCSSLSSIIYKGKEYTSKSMLISELQKNNVTSNSYLISIGIFSDTALND